MKSEKAGWRDLGSLEICISCCQQVSNQMHPSARLHCRLLLVECMMCVYHPSTGQCQCSMSPISEARTMGGIHYYTLPDTLLHPLRYITTPSQSILPKQHVSDSNIPGHDPRWRDVAPPHPPPSMQLCHVMVYKM